MAESMADEGPVGVLFISPPKGGMSQVLHQLGSCSRQSHHSTKLFGHRMTCAFKSETQQEDYRLYVGCHWRSEGKG
jgi:hypothetical protein